MKATEQLYCGAFSYAVQGGSNLRVCGSAMISQSVAIQMKATEQYFPVVLFIMLYKVVLTCEPSGRNP